MLTGVEGLGNGLEVNETAGEIKVGVGDGARRVVGCDKEAIDVVWPLNSPEGRDVSLPALPGIESIAWKIRASSI